MKRTALGIAALSTVGLGATALPAAAQATKEPSVPAKTGQAAVGYVAGAATKANELFCRAATVGNIEMATLALQQGADANYRCIERPDDYRYHEKLPVIATAQGLLPLIFSRTALGSNLGSMEVVDLLLKYGADANFQARNGRRLLHDAIDLAGSDQKRLIGGLQYKFDSVKEVPIGNFLIDRLVKHGADFTFLDSAGESMVWYTYRLGCDDKERCERQEKLVDLLLSKGNSLDAVNAKGETLLFVAASGCGIGLTKTLIGRGIDRRIRNKEGQTALDKALNTATSTNSASDLGKRCNEVVALLMGTASDKSQFGPSAQSEKNFSANKVVEFGKILKDCDDCPEMMVVPAGSFKMGSNSAEEGRRSNEGPQHLVTIARPFAIGKIEVTRGQWEALMGPLFSVTKCGSHCPLGRVSWDEATEFARRLSAKTGKKYRLPSEAEWEYACRGGTQQLYCGSDDAETVGWHAGNHNRSDGGPNPPAKKSPNAFGLHDMSGNLLEWVQDCWHDNYTDAPSDGSAWIGIQPCEDHVTRGGSYTHVPATGMRAAYRERNGSLLGGVDGFRLVRELEP